VIDFVGIRGSQMAVYVSGTSVKLTNVKLPILPQELVGSFDENNWFRVYINGVYYTYEYYEYTYDATNKEIIFTFVDTDNNPTLPFQIQPSWEVAITGKFIQL
jgi:hypothetical protein